MKYILSFIAALIALSITQAAAAQDDVPAKHPHRAAVEYVRTEGIMFDDPDGAFHPDALVSRVDFTVTVLDALYAEEDYRGCYKNIASSLPVRFTKVFSDVATTDWYGQHLCVGIHAGLINGNRDFAFRPTDNITAAEASKILAKAYGLVYPSLRPTAAPWYEPFMRVMRERGALAKNVGPSSALTRADVAAMFHALRNQERYPRDRVIGDMFPLPDTSVTWKPGVFRLDEKAATLKRDRVSRRTLIEEVMNRGTRTMLTIVK